MTTASGAAFYADLAQTAVDLLDESGGTIILERYATAFDRVTQQGVQTLVTQRACNGVFTTQKKMPSGSRVENDQRIVVLDGNAQPRLKDKLRMPAQFTATSGGAMSGAVVESDFPAVWTIAEVEVIAPAGTPVCYFVKVEK